jgi:hypothetical protein
MKNKIGGISMFETTKKKLLTGAILAGLGLSGLSGCVIREQVVAAPPPPPGGEVVVATDDPPPDVVEVRPIAPGPDYVWIGGFYAWRGGRYVWQRGYWGRPPYGRSYWQAGHWEHRPHGYVFIGGYWR